MEYANTSRRGVSISGLRRSGIAIVSVLAFGTLGASIAGAAPVEVPGSVNPAQVEKQFRQAPTVPEAPNLALPAPNAPPELPEGLRKQLEEKKIELKSVIIEGATVYSAGDLKFAYEDMIGQTVSLLDVQTIAQRITDKYHKDGYLLSQAIIPPQEITDGVLTVRVVEGYISNVIIEGEVDTDGERDVIQSYGDHIKKARPVQTKDLERYLLLINDLPGTSVSGLLRPSADQFGAADLVLTVAHKTYAGAYTLDNRGTKFIGPWQHAATVVGNSLFGMYDRTQLRVLTVSPFKDMVGIELQHGELVDSEGTVVNLLASHTRTNPGDSLRALSIVGNSDIFEAKATHPFLRARRENFTGRAVLDIENADTNIFNTTLFSKDRLRVFRLGGTFNALDDLAGNNIVDVQFSQGMNIFGASDSGTTRSNAVADSDFSKFNLDASRLQQLPNNLSVLTSASAQYSFNPLLVAEQFSLGGPEYARAFDPGELLGDQGIAGKIELRYDQAINEPFFDSFELFGFYDIGHVWLEQAAAGANDKTTLSSIGIGIRTIFTENFSSALEADMPLIKPASDQTDYRHDTRIFFTATARF